MKNCYKNLIVILYSGILLLDSVGWEYIGSLSKSYIDELNESCNTEYSDLSMILIANLLENRPNCRGAEIYTEDSLKDPDLLNIYAFCNKWSI